MFISQPCYIKVDDKVKLVKVYKIYDLIYGSGDTLELIDDEGNIFLRKYWEINAVVKKELKELDLNTIKTEEIKYDPIENEREDEND